MSRTPVPGGAALALKAQLEATLKSVPGVAAVGFSNSVFPSSGLEIDGRPLPASAGGVQRVDAGYLAALGLRTLSGRLFTPVEGDSDAPVAVVDVALAAHLWPGLDPVGHRLTDTGGKARTVIGVVPHARWRLSLDTPPVAYVPLDPTRSSRGGVVSLPHDADAQAEAAISHAVRDVRPGAWVTVWPVFDQISLRDGGQYQFEGPIVAMLGTIAVLLAALGLYGLVTYLVEGRVREFGVRLALGARRQDLWRTVMRQSLLPTLVGVTVGLTGSLWTGGLLRTLLFGVTPTNPALLAAVGSGLVLVAFLAAVRPALHVMRIDPVRVLRAE